MSARDDGWRRTRPAPGTPPPSFIAAVTELRRQIAALADEVATLRLAVLELLDQRLEEVAKRRLDGEDVA